MPFLPAVFLKCAPPWLQAILPRTMSQPDSAGPARPSDIPTGSAALPRTKKLRRSLERTSTRLAADGRNYLALRSTPFFRQSDEEALRMFGEAFGPELGHLKSAKPSVEASSTETLGEIGADRLSPSRFLFGEDFSEVNRTLVGVLALKWIVNDNYGRFTAHQPLHDRLSPASWTRLQTLFATHLRTDGEVYALLVATIVNDLGKNPDLVQSILDRHPASPGAAAPNHDQVIHLAAEHGDIDVLNEFEGRSALHTDLLTGLRLGATLNIGQLAQAENVPGSLRVVRNLRPSAHAFALKFLEILLDVAGAQGSADARGAVLFTEPLFGTYEHARCAVELLISNPTTSLRGAYDCVLRERANVVRAAGFDPTTSAAIEDLISLDPAVAAGRAFLRLLCMTRTFAAGPARRVAGAFAALDPASRRRLTDGLNIDGDADGPAILPYYAPALFSNALRATAGDEAQSVRALAAVMRLLARMFRGTRPQPGRPGRVIECDLSVAQAATKADADDPIGRRFAADPDVLDELEIPLDRYSEEL